MSNEARSKKATQRGRTVGSSDNQARAALMSVFDYTTNPLKNQHLTMCELCKKAEYQPEDLAQNCLDTTGFLLCSECQARRVALCTANRQGRIWSLTVEKCPLCGQRHHHGGGHYDAPYFGHRVSHCAGDRLGYILVDQAGGVQ